MRQIRIFNFSGGTNDSISSVKTITSGSC